MRESVSLTLLHRHPHQRFKRGRVRHLPCTPPFWVSAQSEPASPCRREHRFGGLHRQSGVAGRSADSRIAFNRMRCPILDSAPRDTRIGVLGLDTRKSRYVEANLRRLKCGIFPVCPARELARISNLTSRLLGHDKTPASLLRPTLEVLHTSVQSMHCRVHWNGSSLDSAGAAVSRPTAIWSIK